MAPGLVLYEVSTCDCSGEEEVWTESLWTVDVATGRRRHLTPRTGGFEAAWSPDGTKIAYVSSADFELWTMNADGSRKRRLTRGAFVSSPSWSPDGRSIAFGRSDPRLRQMPHWWSSPRDGSRRRTLGREPAGVDDVAWSPDGKRIAYHTPGFGKNAISIIRTSDKDRRWLAAGGGPTWSPEGRWIAFTVPPASEVEIVRPDGSGRRALTTTPGIDRDPAWSADGHQIAFVSERRGVTRLYLMRSDGRGQRRVTRDAGTGDTSNWWEDDPAWSPSGDWIAYTIESLSTREGIHVVNADGTGRRQLVSANAHDPLWRPQSQTP